MKTQAALYSKRILLALLRLRFGIFWLSVFVTLILVPWLTRKHPNKSARGEWYPFSNFPMYSSFEKQAYYVYVTDLNDEALPLVPIFNTWASAVKKKYDGYLKQDAKELKKPSKRMTAEESRNAGDRTLREVRDNSREKELVQRYPGFRLYQVDITLEDGVITKREKMVGEIK